MRFARFVVVALAGSFILALAVASWPVVSPGPAHADDLSVSQRVRNELANNGRVRVIVELRLSSGAFIPEGHLRTPAAVAAQRRDIASLGRGVLSLLQGRTYRVVHQFETLPYLSLEVGPDALAELAAAPFHVNRVVEDALYEAMLPTSVPLIGANNAWNAGFDGTGMTVAILDTGVDKTHPMVAGKVVEEACFSSAASSFCPHGQQREFGSGSGVNCPRSALFGSSLCAHGTHVAGIAAGNGAQAGVPFSGVAKGATIMAVQIFSFAGTSITTSTTDITAGLERVYQCATGTASPPCSGPHDFAAVNLSVGRGLYPANCDNDSSSASMRDAINQLRSVGIATVVASGNDSSPNSISTPACISTAVSVGATTNDPGNAVSSLSNVAPFLSLFAPGDAVLSSAPFSPSSTCSSSAYPGFFYCRGTSMAAPHVTGAFAILRQAAPGEPAATRVSTFLNALQQTGVPITADTRRIQVDSALAALAPQPPHTLTVTSTNPPSGVAITVSPADKNAQGGGTTPFSRVYAGNTVVNVAAATTAQSKTFQKWQRDGVDLSTNPSVQVAMDADHTLNAVYVVSDFVDVSPSHPFWSWIEALFRAGITAGCGTNPPVFCPDQTVSRAEMAVFLLRSIHGAGYAPPTATSVFADVPVSDPLAPWIDRLFAEGIVSGCGTNPLLYCPSDDVTRAQMAFLLLRAKHGAGYQPPAASGLFADVASNDPSAPWIERLFAEGVTTGCGTNPLRYCPSQSVTRGQMAAFLDRTFGFPP